MSTFTVRLGHPDGVLSPNARRPVRPDAAARLHYKQIAEKQKVRRVALLVTRSLLGGRVFRPRGYELVWYYKGVQPDSDNCLGRCKAVLDGCAAALGVDDRVLECLGVRRVHSLERGVAGTLDVVFTGTWEVIGNCKLEIENRDGSAGGARVERRGI